MIAFSTCLRKRGNFESLVCIRGVDGGDLGLVGCVQQNCRHLCEATAGAFISNRWDFGVRLLVLALEKFKIEWNAAGFGWAALGGFLAFAGFLTFFAALDQGKASTVVTLSALYPLVTILMSIGFLHEKLSMRQGIGIVAALIASVLLAE